jgi:hypothetical protein
MSGLGGLCANNHQAMSSPWLSQPTKKFIKRPSASAGSSADVRFAAGNKKIYKTRPMRRKFRGIRSQFRNFFAKSSDTDKTELLQECGQSGIHMAFLVRLYINVLTPSKHACAIQGPLIA